MNTLLSTNLKNLKRKAFLEPLAISKGINPKKFKTKHLLKEAIISKEFENDTDPITLEKILNIDYCRLISWKQDDRWYAADVESMYNYVKISTINPWAIDLATGCMRATSNELYLERFDMKNVDGLLDEINTRYLELADDAISKTIPSHVIERDIIEKCGDGLYITHIIDFLENQTDPKVTLAILYDSLFGVINQFIYQLNITNLGTYRESLDTLEILDQMLLSLRIHFRNVNPDKTSLNVASTFFQQCNDLLSSTVIERIFDLTDYTIKEFNTHTTD
jgi:hypothetical protein